MSLIHEIENKSAAELKADGPGLSAEVAGAIGMDDGCIRPGVIAASYIHTLTDAKLRDEKLAVQGETITALQEECNTHQRRCTVMTKACGEATAKAANLIDQFNEVKGERDDQRKRADRLKAEAMRNRKALGDAANILTQAIQAQVVEDADTGE